MNVQLTGGEMLVWSDLDGTHGPGPVRGIALSQLLAQLDGRTLVAGPHDPALLDALPAGQVTVLVRGVPDAQTLATRYADRPGVTVLCGGLDQLAGQQPFDTVVALDGLDRLASAENTPPTWEETFAALTAALARGGRLLLGLENLFGLHRLVTLPAEPTDSAWTEGGEHDPGRPAGLGRARATLEAAGLAVGRAYAAYPSPVAPTVLLDAPMLADAEHLGFLQAVLGQAYAQGPAALTDPARLAGEAARHGTAAELAPGWVFVADRAAVRGAFSTERLDGAAGAAVAGGDEATGSAGAAAAVRQAVPSGPDGVVTTAEAGVLVVHRNPAGGWTRRRTGTEQTEPVPAGRTLQDLLLGACLRRDRPRLGGLLTAWQGGEVAGVPADQVVVEPGGGLAALASAGSPYAALYRLAAAFLHAGTAHLWPSPATPGELAMTLAAMAGREVDAESPAGPDAAAAGVDWPDEIAYRDLAAERDRLVGELAAARAKVWWYEQMLTSREDSLKRAQRIITLLTGRGPARAGKALVGGAKAAKRTARAVVRGIQSR